MRKTSDIKIFKDTETLIDIIYRHRGELSRLNRIGAGERIFTALLDLVGAIIILNHYDPFERAIKFDTTVLKQWELVKFLLTLAIRHKMYASKTLCLLGQYIDSIETQLYSWKKYTDKYIKEHTAVKKQ